MLDRFEAILFIRQICLYARLLVYSQQIKIGLVSEQPWTKWITAERTHFLFSRSLSLLFSVSHVYYQSKHSTAKVIHCNFIQIAIHL